MLSFHKDLFLMFSVVPLIVLIELTHYGVVRFKNIYKF